MSICPCRCGSSPDPVTCTSASSVPATLVTAVVKPWMMPRFSAVRRDVQVDPVAARLGARGRPALRLNSVIGTEPFAVIASVGDCCSVASSAERVRRVVDVGLERLVLVGLEGAVDDLDVTVDDRVSRPCRRSSHPPTACRPGRDSAAAASRAAGCRRWCACTLMSPAGVLSLQRERAVDGQRLIAARPAARSPARCGSGRT